MAATRAPRPTANPRPLPQQLELGSNRCCGINKLYRETLHVPEQTDRRTASSVALLHYNSAPTPPTHIARRYLERTCLLLRRLSPALALADGQPIVAPARLRPVVTANCGVPARRAQLGQLNLRHRHCHRLTGSHAHGPRPSTFTLSSPPPYSP
ncbi:hypothetical protein CC78DRAFT_583893 [Lojkania enalia]|uniref:Uncharacterized protein n=1 Tax=Lojkania enalia TaxID=147567 RepID=A0A9P4K1L4_9PLEO|nr:hypothetical protein CC78DRAFT_583893 [Didymosphaeria enalia]